MGSLIQIDDPRITGINSSCLSNRSGITPWQYNSNDLGANKSSITILSRSLQSKRTYQFMVYMENRHNAALQATGYVLVQITDTQPQMVVIAYVISLLI